MTREGLDLLRSAVLDSGRVVIDPAGQGPEARRRADELVAEGLLAAAETGDVAAETGRLVYHVTEKGRVAVIWQDGSDG